MYKEVLTSIESVEIYPIISFAIFFCFFTFLLFQVWRSDNKVMTRLSALPLDSGEGKTATWQYVDISSQGKTSSNHD